MSRTLSRSVQELVYSNNYRVDDWIWGGKLGEGAFGSVKKCSLKNNKNAQVAMKVMKPECKNEAKLIENEKQILNCIEHPFIMKYYGYMEDQKSSYFITELVRGEDLFTYHRYVGNFNSKQTAFYGAQIISIFEYLHSVNIAYRDLKPENIMINHDGYIKLIDFGFAKVIKNRSYTVCGTPEYIAPEILLNKGHGKEVDLWTLGILLYEMHAGYPPFQDDDPMDLYTKTLTQKPRFPTGFDTRLKSLIKHLLRREFTKRLCDSKKIMCHRFFEEIEFDDLLVKKLNAPYLPGKDNRMPVETSNKCRRNGISWNMDENKENILEGF